MATITWTNEFSVNNNSLDDQHKRLFQLINEFYESFSNNNKNEMLNKLVRELLEYSHYHFTTEENFMKKNNFPDLPKHKQEHEEFIKKVNNYIDRIETGKLIISLEITNFIKSWLTNHIMQTDKKYAVYLEHKA